MAPRGTFPDSASMIRLTMPHWYGFNRGVRVTSTGSLTEDEWDRLREQDAAFGFGNSREEWAAKARSNPAFVERANAVSDLLQRWGAQRLVSVGVGTGLFEFLVKSALPEIVVRCGDSAPGSIDQLRVRFHESITVEPMDLRRPTWVREPDEIVLLNRVDTELADGEWVLFFSELARRGARRIIWIPAGLLTVGSALLELRGLLGGLAKGRHLMRAGYLRTSARMTELFSAHYERREVIKRGDHPTWGLHLRERG
jgi:hypothetical protein